MTSDFIIKLIADGLIVVIALLATIALLFGTPKNGRYAAYCRILMAGLTAYLVAKLIASVYQPEIERPFELLGEHAKAAFLNNPGFPSDHALFAMVLSLAVWFETNLKKLGLLLFGLTIVMSIGRVLALVHTPLDVIGGIVIACSGIVWYQWRPKVAHKKPVKNTGSHKTQK